NTATYLIQEFICKVLSCHETCCMPYQELTAHALQLRQHRINSRHIPCGRPHHSLGATRMVVCRGVTSAHTWVLPRNKPVSHSLPFPTLPTTNDQRRFGEDSSTLRRRFGEV